MVSTMFSYDELKLFLIANLTQDAVSHEEHRYYEIGAGFDEMEANLPDGDAPEFDRLFLARSFWEGWIDARNHDWAYYEHIKEKEWSVLAKRIASALALDSEIDDPQVMVQFRRIG